MCNVTEQIKIAVLLATGFEEIEAVFPIDFFRRANISIVPISTENEIVIKGMNGIGVETDCRLIDIDIQKPLFNAIIIPGGLQGSENLSQNSMVIQFLKRHHEKKSILAAICAAPYYVLGKHGFLKTTDYTCYPSLFKEAEKFIGRAPQKEHVIYDNFILTSQGVATVSKFSHKLLCLLLKNHDLADNIMKGLLF